MAFIKEFRIINNIFAIKCDVMPIPLNQQWKHLLREEMEKDYFLSLIDFVQNEYETKIIYPPKELIFEALNQTSFSATKVVIIGQDPYHGPGQANGLSFSVNDGIKLPPSLKNIYKELKADMDIDISTSGNLLNWAQQGVLLLNATLTVEAAKAGSHQKKGWETFTDAVIQHLSDNGEHLVFILWGAYAQKKGQHINRDKHHVIESPHPSPLGAYRGFFDSKPFSKANTYLAKSGKETINWFIK